MAQKYFYEGSLDKILDNKRKRIENDKTLSKRNRDIILKFLHDAELGLTIDTGQKRKIAAGRNLQMASYLLLMCKEWFPRTDLDKITRKQMEKFILGLDRGTITTSDKRREKKPYSIESRKNIKKGIRKFYKYLMGNNKVYPDLVSWLDTSGKNAEIEAIPGLKDGVWEMVELVPDLKKKALIWAAFDSGFRESEILHCRVKDAEKRSDGIYYLTCRVSKTKPRTVSLPYASDLLDRWLTKHPLINDPEAQLWQTSRIGYYKTVKRYGLRVHKRNISVHMIRHTSATFWATMLDRTTFCKKFGWSFNSSSPDRYIDYAKIPENKVIDVVSSTEMGNMKREIEKIRVEKNVMNEEMRKKIDEIDQLKLDYGQQVLKIAKERQELQELREELQRRLQK